MFSRIPGLGLASLKLAQISRRQCCHKTSSNNSLCSFHELSLRQNASLAAQYLYSREKSRVSSTLLTGSAKTVRPISRLSAVIMNFCITVQAQATYANGYLPPPIPDAHTATCRPVYRSHVWQRLRMIQNFFELYHTQPI
jgi:hypothetical protein